MPNCFDRRCRRCSCQPGGPSRGSRRCGCGSQEQQHGRQEQDCSHRDRRRCDCGCGSADRTKCEKSLTDVGVTLIHNAKIYTQDESSPKADYVLVRGNRIVEVGCGKPPKVGNGAKVIDAKGRALVPGIQDQHLHMMRQMVNPGHELHEAEDAFTLKDLLDALKKKVKEVPTGEWISFIGRHNHLQFLADENDPNSGRYPTAEELDAIAPNHFVVFLQRFEPTVDPAMDANSYNNPVFSGAGQLNSKATEFVNALPETGLSEIQTMSQIYQYANGATSALGEKTKITAEAFPDKLVPSDNSAVGLGGYGKGRIPDWNSGAFPPNGAVVPNRDGITGPAANPFANGQTGNQLYLWFRDNKRANTFDLGDIQDNIKSMMKWAMRKGLTGVSDAGGFGFRQITDHDPLAEADRNGDLCVRIRYQHAVANAPGCTSTEPDDNLAPVRNLTAALPYYSVISSIQCPDPLEIPAAGFALSRVGSPFFKNNGLGENFGGADDEQAARMLLRRPDWKMNKHVEANQISPAIAAYTAANSDPCAIGSIGSRHWSLEHLNCATEQDFRNMASVGLGAGIQAVRFMFPDWQYEGPPYALAEKIAKEDGLVVGFGADGMHAAHGNPWITMQFMVTGESFNGEQILANDNRGDQRISLEQGLRGYTKNSAWFTREEHERGQVKPGYLADLVLLNQDPHKVAPRDIRKTESVLTIVDGEIKHNPCRLA